MSANSNIEWTDHTFNPWSGCTKVAEGCRFCYAEVNYSVKMRGVKWGPSGNRIMASESMWKEPLKWDRKAAAAGVRHRVFCASLADVFEEWEGPILDHHGDELKVCECGYLGTLPVIVPELARRSNVYGCPVCDTDPTLRAANMHDIRKQLFALIDATPHLDWLLLTKRPENIRQMWPDQVHESENWFFDPEERKRRNMGDNAGPYKSTLTIGNAERKNVWLMTSIATPEDAERNIPHLCRCGDLAPVLGVSYEPAIEAVDLVSAVQKRQHGDRQPNWVIVGGESGHNARYCNVAWIRSIVEQCQAANVPCFVKQMGSHSVASWGDPSIYDMTIHGQVSERSMQLGENWQIKTTPDESLGQVMFKDKKGGDINEWAPEFRVRQFPEVQHA